ncbi:protoporphyrinogen oxidase [Horticoccus sp. 23ND18S-11]|uniref:protoporphyrinogen oxidase n=1 Tax=Horticoccus sp. 23ND18S-11 TaxID=3391832 RepID=UPI0039C97B1C
MHSLNPVPRVAVLGAGITGLTAAWHLERAGLRAVVFERSPRVGGAIGTHRQDGWLHELGPNSMLEGAASVATFITGLGLGPRRVYASPVAQNRYIVRGGKLVAMPTSPGRFITTPLFSLGAKLALLGEPFRARGAADAEESVAEFVVRRLGREFLDYAVNPFVGGVYAGDPKRLSVRHGFPKLRALEQEHGSLIRGAIARRNTSGGPKGSMFSFPNGLEELPLALAAQLGEPVRTSTQIRAIRRRDEVWEIAFTGRDGADQTELFSAVVCALPADALAGLPFDGVPSAARLTELRAIEHPPVVSVFTGYRRENVAHPLDGFGALMPEVEKGGILGTLFSSTLFPGRAPEGHVALTSFVGGTRQPELAQLDDPALLNVVRQELGRLVGAKGEPAYVHLQRWPRAIPQYTLGYGRFKDVIAAAEAGAPGLFIGGNCRDGISLANCIDAGHRLAAAAQGGALRTLHAPA